MHDFKNFITINETAKRLRITRLTVYAMIKEGKFEHITVGVINSKTLINFDRFVKDNLKQPVITKKKVGK